MDLPSLFAQYLLAWDIDTAVFLKEGLEFFKCERSMGTLKFFIYLKNAYPWIKRGKLAFNYIY